MNLLFSGSREAGRAASDFDGNLSAGIVHSLYDK